jgi:hypothetical protein
MRCQFEDWVLAEGEICGAPIQWIKGDAAGYGRGYCDEHRRAICSPREYWRRQLLKRREPQNSPFQKEKSGENSPSLQEKADA